MRTKKVRTANTRNESGVFCHESLQRLADGGANCWLALVGRFDCVGSRADYLCWSVSVEIVAKDKPTLILRIYRRCDGCQQVVNHQRPVLSPVLAFILVKSDAAIDDTIVRG